MFCSVGVTLKQRKTHWAGKKTTTTRSGIRETATTRKFALWLFLNNHSALWHVKICVDAEVVPWLWKELTTTRIMVETRKTRKRPTNRIEKMKI